jgi:hypothetical protein
MANHNSPIRNPDPRSRLDKFLDVADQLAADEADELYEDDDGEDGTEPFAENGGDEEDEGDDEEEE